MEKDYIIENGVLVSYRGKGGDIVIPNEASVIAAKVFKWDVIDQMTSITITNSVKEIEEGAFNSFGVQNLSPSWYRNQKLNYVIISDELAAKLTIPKIKKIFSIDSLVNALLKNPNGFQGKFKEKLVKFIKEHKKEIVDEIVKYDDVEMMDHFLQLIKVSLDDVERYINATENAKNSKMLMSYLLNYKNEHFTIKTIEEHEEQKINYELGIEERTMAQWRKIYKIRMLEDGIEIAGYKSEEENVIVPSKMESHNVIKIATECFKNCRHIQSVIIPEGIKQIEYQQFVGCKFLKEVQLSSSIKNIEYYAFERCEKLESLSIPKGVKKLKDGTFMGCTGLQEIHLTKSIKDIPRGVFNDCKKLSIYAPVGSYAEAYAKEHNIPFVAE